MPTYIILSKWTDQGIREVDNVAERERRAKGAAARLAGSHTVYFTLGEYDAVNIVEAPTEEEAAAYALEIGTHGNIRTTTLRAFTHDEFARILARRPRWESAPPPGSGPAPGSGLGSRRGRGESRAQ